MGEACDRAAARREVDGAAGKRGEESDVVVLEAGVQARPREGLPGSRRKLVELRLLPRDWASTRPSEVALNLELA